MNLGKAIKFYRVGRDMNQQELADASQLSVSYLSLLERNKRDPNISTVERIASALNISVLYLMVIAEDIDKIAALNPHVAEKLTFVVMKLREGNMS
jgi:transcriptional regulator with XRE-family HTH domain